MELVSVAGHELEAEVRLPSWPESMRPELTRPMNHRLSFIYADDDDLCREFMSHLFARYLPNARLTLATSGQEALAFVRSNPPDILLLDVHLADMTGLDVIDIVRSEPATTNTQIIVVSADRIVHDWEETSLNHWLGKPFTVNEFLRLVASVS